VPSLSIAEGDDGRALLYCHGGCATADVIAVLGLQMRDLFPRSNRRGTPGDAGPAHGLAHPHGGA
jgi:hypothetical protein